MDIAISRKKPVAGLRKHEWKSQRKILKDDVYLRKMEKLRRKLVKNLRRKLNFLLIFVLFIACTNSNKLNIEEFHILEKTGEINIKLNKKGLSISDYQIREINKDIEIIRANYGYETLSIYSLNKSKEIGIIKLDLNNLMPFFEKGSGISGFFFKRKGLLVCNELPIRLIINRPKYRSIFSKLQPAYFK